MHSATEKLRGEAPGCPGRGNKRLWTQAIAVTVWFQEEVYPLWAAEKEQVSPGALPLGGDGNHGD